MLSEKILSKIEFKLLSDVSPSEIITVFNHSFADYLLPFQLTESSFLSKLKAENIQWQYSVGAFHKAQLVGFILIGIDIYADIQIAYNAGTGVIPAYRGNFLTKKMYQFLFPLLAKDGIGNHLLEVLTENKYALNAYQHTGFKIVRNFTCYKGFISPDKVNSYIIICEKGIDELSITPDFINQLPAYQNTLSTIQRRVAEHICLVAFQNNSMTGFLIFEKDINRIKQFAVHKNFRRMGIASTLFQKMNQMARGNMVSCINIDKSDLATNLFLEKMGLEQYMQQFEMRYKYEN